MKSTAKAEALLRDVADKLAKRFANGAGINTVRADKDSNGWPMLFLSAGGNEAESQPVIAIRITGQDLISKDVFGNASTSYAPHTLEVAYELAAANKPECSLGDLAVVKFEAIKTGVRFQEKAIANLSAVTAANMDATAAIADCDEIYWPTKSV